MEMQRESLLSAIRMVLPAVAKEEYFDQANKVAFIDGRVVAFNDAVGILHPLNLDAEAGGLDLEGAVDGPRLCEYLAKLSTETVDLIYGDSKLDLRAGRSRATFDVLSVKLPIDSIDMSGEMVDLPNGFVDQLRWVSTSCAKDMSRPVLSCVLVEGGWMQASDGYRASRVRCGDTHLPRLMLPLAQIKVLLDYPIRRMVLSNGGEWARFETEDGTMLCTRSMSARFPDLEMLFDVRGREVHLTDALDEAIGRARIFAKRGVAIEEEVRIDMRVGMITVSARCDGAEFSEDVECEGVEEGVSFSIHPRFLATALEFGTRCVLGERSAKFYGADWEHVCAMRGS